MEQKKIKILLRSLYTFVFIGIFLAGCQFYRINQEGQIAELKEKEEIIKNLQEELAELTIKNNAFVAGAEFDFTEAVENFNEDYKTRKEILEYSNNIKGVYITKLIANADPQDLNARNVLENIKNLLHETELNAVVIDVKETDGFELSDVLRELIDELHQENIWVIARFVAFRDSSLIEERPDLYIKNKEGNLWSDEKGYYWLDPASSQVQKYLIDLSYKVIDFGFDEIQFDYIRFPVGNNEVVYPFYNNSKEKREIIRNFCLKVRNNLRNYKSDIVLSVDLFGEVAILSSSPSIGQNIADFVDVFDYISFMIYPSHFFGGFSVEKDLEHNLPAVYFPYEDEDISKVVSSNPYNVVYRSLLSGSDYVSLFYFQKNFQPQCLGKNNSFLFCSQSKIRPWLQDFDLKIDSDRGIFYDPQKVMSQIKAAEDAGASGWLLWNPSNVYTAEAL